MIEHETTATMMPDGIRVQVKLEYRKLEPYAVYLYLQKSPTEWKPWWFARDLLAHGIQGGDGEGDVKVRPHPGCTQLTQVTFENEDGAVLFHFQRADLVAFLEATYAVCPLGAESKRYTRPWFDGELLRLLDREESA